MSRLRMKPRGTTGESLPVATQAPVITSASPGVYQEGVLLTVTPGTYTGNPYLEGYQWRLDGVAISGATSASYSPTATDVGGTITCTETVRNSAGPLATTTAGVGPILAETPPDLGDAFAGVNATTLTERARIVSEFDNVWPGYQDETLVVDQLVTSASDLTTKWNALKAELVAGTKQRSAWYRFRLDSTQANSVWFAGVTIEGASNLQHTWTLGAYYGSPTDLSTYGGGVLIESSDSNNPVDFTGVFGFAGARGFHLRNITLCKAATAVSTVASTHMVSITSNSTRRDACVVRIEDCNIGISFNPTTTSLDLAGTGIKHSGGAMEQLDVINCRFSGFLTGISTAGVRFHRSHGNDFQQNIADCQSNLHTSRVSDANSAWDERVIHWHRLNTARNAADAEKYSGVHCDANQHGTTGDIGNYDILNEFETYYLERVEGTDGVRLEFTANPTDGKTITLDGVTLTFRTTPTLATDVQIGGTISSTLQGVETYFMANKTPNLVYIDTPSTWVEAHYPYGQKGTLTTTGTASSRNLRLAGGTQGLYNDDTPATYNLNTVNINCMMMSSDGICLRMYNGTSYTDRVHCGRPGALAPDATVANAGFNFSQSYTPYITSARKSTSAIAYHYVYSSVTDYLYDDPADVSYTADGTYATTANRTFVASGNRYVNWSDGSTETTTKLAGTFTTDAQGRVAYSFNDDGTTYTQQQFRQALYDQVKLLNVTDRANIGPTSPATWPTS